MLYEVITLGENATAATDVYSLGVVMYEMLSGQLPFASDHEAALVYSIVHETPRALSEISSNVPVGLQSIIMRCLAVITSYSIHYTKLYDVLDDIFAVQDDIASAVSEAMHVTLLGQPKAESKPKVNPESYNLVLRAGQFLSACRFLRCW